MLLFLLVILFINTLNQLPLYSTSHFVKLIYITIAFFICIFYNLKFNIQILVNHVQANHFMYKKSEITFKYKIVSKSVQIYNYTNIIWIYKNLILKKSPVDHIQQNLNQRPHEFVNKKEIITKPWWSGVYYILFLDKLSRYA